MSDHHQEKPKTTPAQFVLALLGGLLAPGLVIFLIFKLVSGFQAKHIEDTDPEIAKAAIVERIKPIGEVALAPVSTGPHIDKAGEQVVTEVCAACHSVGALGSPKIGDASAWGPRNKQGYETLITHALQGIRSMPARGGNPDLTDGEIANAVAYMANKSGAKFDPASYKSASAAAAPAANAAPASTPAPAASATPESPKATAKTEAVVAPEVAKPAEVAAAPAAAGKSGEQVVKEICSACHAVGVMGSPKIGDKAAWGPRIAQGYDTLVSHAQKGIRMMPAKGGNPALSDAEVASAVAYMANQSGANFKAP